MADKRDYMVTVCKECLRASCWHWEFPCDKAQTADLVERKASDLAKLDKEHADHYSPEKLLEVCGSVRWIDGR
jgi:hypothetical protein